VGTIFERSQVPLSKWLLALYLMSASKNGIAANELRRTLDVTQPTAWFMLHRLREAMGHAAPFTVNPTMRGPIEVDETYIGSDLVTGMPTIRAMPFEAAELPTRHPWCRSSMLRLAKCARAWCDRDSPFPSQL